MPRSLKFPHPVRIPPCEYLNWVTTLEVDDHSTAPALPPYERWVDIAVGGRRLRGVAAQLGEPEGEVISGQAFRAYLRLRSNDGSVVPMDPKTGIIPLVGFIGRPTDPPSQYIITGRVVGEFPAEQPWAAIRIGIGKKRIVVLVPWPDAPISSLTTTNYLLAVGTLQIVRPKLAARLEWDRGLLGR